MTRWLRSEGKRWAPGPFCPLLRAARLNFEQEPVTQTTCPLPFSGVPLLLQLEGVGLGGEGGGEDAGA